MNVVVRACKAREIFYNTLRENVIERMLTTGIRSVYSLACLEILCSEFLNSTTQMMADIQNMAAGYSLT